MSAGFEDEECKLPDVEIDEVPMQDRVAEQLPLFQIKSKKTHSEYARMFKTDLEWLGSRCMLQDCPKVGAGAIRSMDPDHLANLRISQTVT